MWHAGRHEVGEIRAGDHVLFIYDETPELVAFAVPFIKAGLAKGERCLYVVGDLELAKANAALEAGGVDVKREIDRGTLSLMDAHAFYGLPPFEFSRGIEMQLKRLAEVRPRGFTGLRVAAEMAWLLELGIGDETLVEYESLLEEISGSDPLTFACMYRRGRFAPAVLQRLVRSHARVIADDYVYLSISALFQNLAQSGLQGLLQSAGERRKGKGEFYFHQGDPATEVYVLTSGKVKLVRADANGRNLILRIVAPTEPFGDGAAFGGMTRPSSAQALEDSRALVWDAPRLLRAMMKYPTVSLNAVRLLETRLELERARLQDLSTSPVEHRLARLLLRLAQSMGHQTPQGVAVELALSGQDLAELVSSTPYSVSRILAEWRRLGIVDAQRDRILVLDEPRIAAIAGMRERES